MACLVAHQDNRRGIIGSGTIVIPPDDPPTSGTPTGPAASGDAVTFTQLLIPISAPEIQNPFRGLVNWNEVCTNRDTGALDTAYVGYGFCPVPEAGSPQPLINVYGRDEDGCNWRAMEPSLGVYNLDWLEARAAAAHAIGGQYGFRIMTYGQDGSGFANTFSNNVMPDYIMNNPGTYGGNGVYGKFFVPNSNNSAYLTRIEALWAAIGARFSGDPRFGLMDIGMYGPAGEWYAQTAPPGGYLTLANGKRIVDAHVNNMPQCQFVALPGDNTSDTPLITEYCMGLQTSDGLWIGQRGDSLGTVNHWYETLQGAYWDPSDGIDQWKRAPLFGEVGNINLDGTTWQSREDGSGRHSGWEDAKAQVIASHVSMVGNGNAQTPFASYTAPERQGWIDAGKYAGYRFELRNITLPNRIEAGSHATFRSEWINVGVAPPYRDWNVHWLLVNQGGSTVWEGTSTMNFHGMLPSPTTGVINENFNFPADLPAGTKSLRVRVIDPTGYFAPMALSLDNIGSTRGSDGSYPLGVITTA